MAKTNLLLCIVIFPAFIVTNISVSNPTMIYPDNVEELTYISTIDYNIINKGFTLERIDNYKITNIEKNKSLYHMRLTETYYLKNTFNSEVICIELKYVNGTTKRVPFTETRNYKAIVDRSLDINDNKVLSIDSKNVPIDVLIIYRNKGDDSESQLNMGGYADTGYSPFICSYKNKTSSDIRVCNSLIGNYTCKYIKEIDNEGTTVTVTEFYVEKESGITLLYINSINVMNGLGTYNDSREITEIKLRDKNSLFNIPIYMWAIIIIILVIIIFIAFKYGKK